MIYLEPNTAAQTLNLTLFEGRQYYATTFTYYLLILVREENSSVGFDLAQVPTIVYDNQRSTQLTVTTVGITTPGRYRYIVYGQNSANNLDPNNAAVVGIVEKGWCIIADNTTYFDVPTIDIPDAFIPA